MGVSSSQLPPVIGAGNNHSPIPQDPVPYPGPAYECRILVVKSKMKASFTGYVVSDVNEYMGTLMQQYAEYFKLVTFFRVPYTIGRSGLTSAICSFQAIFSRPAAYVPSPERWQLQIVPCVLKISATYGNLFSHGKVDTNMADIYEKLTVNANAGGRLICLECTGNRDRGQASWTCAAFGVNMFFDMPSHPNPMLYTNLAYSVPMNISQSFNGTVDVQIDVIGTLAMHLDQGWKLVDVIIPQHEAGVSSTSKHHRYPPSLNTIWFFEKELTRFNANDMTPQYQVTMVDVEMPVSIGFGNCSAQCELSNLLTEMSKRGWSLVCVLDTPKVMVSGMRLTGYLKAFFQRPIMQPPPPSYGPVPPQYTPMQAPPQPGFN